MKSLKFSVLLAAVLLAMNSGALRADFFTASEIVRGSMHSDRMAGRLLPAVVVPKGNSTARL